MGDQWYSNKDLFALIIELRQDMLETRNMIKKYNGLYTKVGEVKEKIEKIESEQRGSRRTMHLVREWGGWIFGLITLLILIYRTIN